jgi:hypothetical protein
MQALQVLRDDLRRHDDSGTPVGTYAHGRLADGAMYLRQGPLHKSRLTYSFSNTTAVP